MPNSAPPVRYATAAILLHWGIAALLVWQFMLGLRLDDIHDLGAKFTAFQMHKSLGITVLVLSLARLGVRLSHRRPLEVGSGWQAFAARATHFLLYLVMIGGPLTGWAVVSSAKVKVPTLLFGVVPWPHLPLGVGANPAADLAHSVLVWLLPALVALHVAGALYHLRLRDEVPGRMVPARMSVTAGVHGGLTLLVLAALGGWLAPIPALWSAHHSAAPAATTAASAPAAGASEAPASAASDPADSASDAAAPSEAAAATPAAAAADWTVAHGSTLGFTAQYAGAAVEGSFKRWDATIHFAEDDLAHARVAATIDLASVDSGDGERDETLKGNSFFDIAQSPKASFVATRFERTSAGHYRAHGTLSLHGVSRPAVLAFALAIKGDKAEAQGTATLSRLAFKVGSGDYQATDQIPDAVAVHFAIHAKRAE